MVTVDGKPLADARARRGCSATTSRPALVTTHHDPKGRPTVFEALPPGLPRLISVGRLDLNSEGLLLLTNDGELAPRLELPATGWLRRYRVRGPRHVDERRARRRSPRASPSTASATARSRPGSTRRRAPMPG